MGLGVEEKPKLYIHVGEATHFLRWELIEFAKYFDLVEEPHSSIPALVFGPDVLEEGVTIPASKRYAVLFPGFGHNPLYNQKIKKQHLRLISKYNQVFINPGPLEIAYKDVENITFYPFSIDVDKVQFKQPRKKVRKIIHISSDYPQKDWKRSKEIMSNTGLDWEVYPPRDQKLSLLNKTQTRLKQSLYDITGIGLFKIPPHGYVDHNKVIKKYNNNDAFVHVAKDIKDPVYIDGKYTATLIEAGLTGCIIFWHDTFQLGNTLETVFEVPLDPKKAALKIRKIINTLDVEEHSRKTHEEMRKKFNPTISVKIRAEAILNDLKMR